MAFTHHHLPSSPFSFIHTHYHHPNPKTYLSLSLSLVSKSKSTPKTPNLFSLFSTPPTSSDLIFLPFLQQQEEEEEDSMIRFFKSRTSSSTQDPQRESKLSLQKNRRSTWHLASDIESETETETDIENVVFVENQKLGHAEEPLPDGIVGEIVRIARELPGNMTLGEALGGYEKRVSEKQCVEVLGLMREKGLLMGCLYFFEWMGLQEPLLLTPRACSVLFPVLGRARMGEKLMVLFRNLPLKKEFRDVHVYNAAISGLLCCGRYNDAWQGWGCAYRSLQTIISWFRLQHYTSIDVPSHREIQQSLLEIDDKDPSFIGPREWIGAIELSFVLDKLLGVSCKVMNFRSGAEVPEKCRELALHFENQGTPIMIGGGVLAYTLLGVDYNEASGDCAFLILDPHYTGNDDLKKIVNGGWCGWKKAVDSKGKSFFLHDKFYNLLLPQRPNMV